MDTFILTTTDGVEHKIHSSDVLTALVAWRQNNLGRYRIDDVVGIHNQEG
ncbi:hypothetical protein [Mycolicibacterium houstonense]|nr:hypothetical protein [Mycolicibacterium houstonense]